MDSFIRDFQSPPTDTEEDIIPDWLFDDRQTLVIRYLFCPQNEQMNKTFLQKLGTFTHEKFLFKIIWNTRNMRSLFALKDHVEHVSCVIYECIGETNRMEDIRWKEHNISSTDKLDPSKQLFNNVTHTPLHGKF